VLQRCRKGRTRVRASRRMRTAPHASRRIAAQPSCGRIRTRWAAMLLSMRARAEEPTCGCRKRSPGPFPCFRPVLYRECRNSNVSSRERTVPPRIVGAVSSDERDGGQGPPNPRPHAEEHRSANGSTNAPAASERCDASRRMRTAELAAGRRTAFGNSQLTMSNSPSRSRGACLRPGFATSLHSPRVEGGRSAERRSGARRNTRGRAHNAARQALARRLASHDAAIHGPK